MNGCAGCGSAGGLLFGVGEANPHCSQRLPAAIRLARWGSFSQCCAPGWYWEESCLNPP